MFVVLALAALAHAQRASAASAPLWYLPALALSWAVGEAVARGFTGPCERRLRTLRPLPASPGRAPLFSPSTSRGPLP